MLTACNADVLAPESTRALIAGIPNSGNEHHSSDPKIIFSCGILLKKLTIKKLS